MFFQRFPNLNSYFIWVENSYPVWLSFKRSTSFKRAVPVILWFKTMTWLIFTSDGIKCRHRNQALASCSGLSKSQSPETFIPPLALVKPLDRPSLPYLLSHFTLFQGPPLLHFPGDSLQTNMLPLSLNLKDKYYLTLNPAQHTPTFRYVSSLILCDPTVSCIHLHCCLLARPEWKPLRSRHCPWL